MTLRWSHIQWLRHLKYRYVLMTTLVSLLTFSRNLLFMKTLNLADLGQLAIMQTLVMLVGFVQLGLINGAYIQYSAHDASVNRRIVDMLGSSMLLLIPFGIGMYALIATSNTFHQIIELQTLAFGLAAGLATLTSTWLNNALVADSLLGTSNRVNLGAVLLSLLLAIFSRHLGLTLALISIMVQPILVVLLVLIIRPELRPQKLYFDRSTFMLVIRLGATPFLGGLAALAMTQVERWTIAIELGSTVLGQFYPVIMFTTFFTLIPAALLNVHFPQAKRAHAAGEFEQFKKIARMHVRDIAVYFLITAIALVLLAPKVVAYLLPGDADATYLLYWALPGLFLYNLRDSASLVLFSTSKIKPLLATSATTLILFSGTLLALSMTGRLSLVSILIGRAFAILPGTCYLIYVKRYQIGNLMDVR